MAVLGVRFLTAADIPAAARCLAYSFANTVLSPEEVAKCRQVDDLAERAKEISRCLSRATNGKITELAQAGSPPAVLLCATPQDLEKAFTEDVAHSISQGLAVGVEDHATTPQLVAVSIAELFDPQAYLSQREDLSGRPVTYHMFTAMKRKFAHALLVEPRFSAYCGLPVLYDNKVGVIPSHRRGGAGWVKACEAKITERARELGAGLTFRINTGPGSHRLSLSHGHTAELGMSESYPGFVDAQGKRPFDAIRFKSVYEGADDMVLLTWRAYTKKAHPCL